MTENDIGLDRLLILYGKLDDYEKEKVIRMTEGLLNSQNIIYNGNLKSTEKNENIALKTE